MSLSAETILDKLTNRLKEVGYHRFQIIVHPLWGAELVVFEDIRVGRDPAAWVIIEKLGILDGCGSAKWEDNKYICYHQLDMRAFLWYTLNVDFGEQK